MSGAGVENVWIVSYKDLVNGRLYGREKIIRGITLRKCPWYEEIRNWVDATLTEITVSFARTVPYQCQLCFSNGNHIL